MNTFFKDETFRDDYTFSNSPDAIARFPFPFWEDKYMYSVNMEPHVKAGRPGSVFEFEIDVDEHYVSDMRDRALVLAEDRSNRSRRCPRCQRASVQSSKCCLQPEPDFH